MAAQETFAQLWNRLLLFAPGTPVPLAQLWVKNAYRRALRLHKWSDLLAEGEKVVATAYTTGTATVTNGSTTVALDGATTDSAWVNRQIRISSLKSASASVPFYTVTSVATDSVTLDRAWQGASSTNAGIDIGEYFVEFPSDLSVLLAVKDINQKWRLRGQIYSQNYLDMVDPLRSYHGSPFTFVPAPPRVDDTSGVSYPRFEFYPIIPAAQHIVYRYLKTHDFTTNTSKHIPGIRPEAILYGAMADLCLWPGLPERPNPYFSMELHAKYLQLAEEQIHLSEMADLDRFQDMVIDEHANQGIPADADWRMYHGIPL